MQDRFKFRGITSYSEWLKGDLITIDNKTFIVVDETCLESKNFLKSMIQVNPETIGQCTGLKDKNGKLIFEGDILKNLPSGMFLLEDEKEKRENIGYWSVEHKIFRGDVGFRVYGKDRRWSKILTPNMIFNCDCEIYGNVYENPELLEVQQ